MSLLSEFLNVSILALCGSAEDHSKKENKKIKEYLNIAERIGNGILKDIQVIKEYTETVRDPHSLELKDIHRLLENNIWLIDDRYRIYSSNISLKNIIKGEIQKKYRSKKRKRPDIICKNNFNDYIIIELKRPNHEVNFSDFTQLPEYVIIIEKHCPNSKLIVGYLIGSKFDEGTRSKRLKGIGIHVLSYNEILTDVKSRYKSTEI